MAKSPTATSPPKTDSITGLARFWDTFDVTTFQFRSTNKHAPTAARKRRVNIPLTEQEIAAVHEIAGAHGLSAPDLIRAWVQEKICTNRQ